ncbi:GlyGly-CTERM domain-containing protein [Pseudoalteromonas sp. DSM 26666]|uniref:M4 family metallopeptidase n=1 Tax=Pseudoalteromonas sp. DSM 26666 TaxID=1761892 RepID=UPI0008E2E92C|nr:M4 family metallopeptidase [Pseudoalteromonas sp. DSM 26666]SFU00524.1 GlyGly-CTERM domain-containing protein [Pseudoalteromonas sp. DSM 26666]
MYKTLSSGLIAFCFLNTLSSQAAVSQRINKSSTQEVKQLLNQNPSIANTSSASSYFVELEQPQLSLSQRVNASSKKMQQYFSGVPVWGQQIRVQSNSEHISGFFAKNINFASLNKTATATFDELKAVKSLLTKSKLDDSLESEIINNKRYIYIHDGKAYYVRLIELKVTENGIEKMPIGLISESTYQIFELWDNIQSVDGKGPGGNQKIGQYEYGTDKDAFNVTQVGDTCFLENDKVKTVTMESGSEPSEAFSFTCNRNTHKEINGAFSPLNDAHAFGTAVFDMYQQWYNTAPLTFQLLMRVHSGDNWENATWNGQAMTFGDGADRFYPLVSLDIVSHEVSHGFTSQNSNLIYSNQSGGINESFSDMAGETAEYFLRGETDWLSGADISKVEPALRYFETPSLDGVSIDKASDFYPGMDVHFSSGVFNRAFFLLSNTDGWDPQKAFEIMLKANQNYWVSSSGFIDGACGAINSAIDLRYNASDVISAFNEVEVICDNIKFVDTDSDLMDDNWELLYGLDPSDADDANLDLDQDGLSNLEEYLANTLPNSVDTDADSLSDYDELNVYMTLPNNVDSDSDRMPDGWEVTFSFNPLDAADAELDFDSDSWANLIEYYGNSDPTDPNSEPSIFPETTYNFDDAVVPEFLVSSTPQTPWFITDYDGHDGLVLTNSDITDSQQTSVEFQFISDEQRFVNFNYLLETEANYDFFKVYINDTLVLDESGLTDWKVASFPLPTGFNTVKFVYTKDVIVSEGLDAVFIDNLYIGPSFPDSDGDGMSDMWELSYGLDINTDDSALDLDNDGLSNLLEFLNNGLPNNSDTDGDLMPDGWEYNNSLNLTDAADASQDADNDGFTNFTEYQANTDPQSDTSYPVVLNITTSFEGDTLPTWMTESVDSSAPFFITNDFATQGSQSIRSGDITDSQFSGFTVTGLFEEGVLAFDYKIDSEACCDFFIVTIDGQEVIGNAERGNLDAPEPTSFLVNISEGVHKIEFKYTKDGSVSTDADAVWLDNFAMLPVGDQTDTDNDQMPDYWELLNGLNRFDASDALSDKDADSLSALDEYNLGTNPNSSDTDSDELSDGYEVINGLLPLDPSDASLDSDADGYTNIQEFYGQSLANDATSTVQSFSQLNESFEEGLLPAMFTELAEHSTQWQLNTNWSTDGTSSLSLNASPAGSISGFAIAGLFEAGFINLDYFSNSNSSFQISVNGTQYNIKHYRSRLLIPVNDGFNIVKVKYESPYLADMPFSVDNISWTAELDVVSDFDGDGIPDYWEAQNGLNALDSYDASNDPDYDGLSNLNEYQMSSNPLSTDTDGDGVQDSEDSHPTDSSLGENIAPVFVSSLEPITLEATSQNTNLTNIFVPEATDNGHLEPYVYAASGSYLPLGEHQITWVARDYVGNETTAIQTVTLVDTTPPVIQNYYSVNVYGSSIDDIKAALFNSNAIYDSVSDVATIDIDSNFVFRTGDTLIPVSAADGAGNTSTGEINARVFPKVSIQPTTYVYQDGNAVIDVFISGKSPYGSVSFDLIGNNTSKYISTNQHGLVKVVLEREFFENASNIRINTRSSSFTDRNDTSQLVFLNETAKPEFITNLYQNGKVISKIVQRDSSDFIVDVHAVNLPSAASDNSIELQLSSQGDYFVNKIGPSKWNITFTPQLLTDSDNLDIAFTIKQNSEAVATDQISLRVIDAVTFNDPELDTDGDGISDAEEGVSDGDKDGIVDYLDSSSITHSAVLDSGDMVRSIDEFNHLSVGDIKQATVTQMIADMSISEQDLSTYFDSLDIAEPHFQAKSDIVNIHITLSNSSGTSEIAIPEYVNSILSSEMQIRLLSNTGWQSVSMLTGNVYEQICSGCFTFAVTDGSEFDLDGQVNGEIELVAKLAEESLNQAPVLDVTIPATIEELTTIELDASGTTDPDGDLLSFEWSIDHPQLSLTPSETDSKATLTVGEIEQTFTTDITLLISDGYEQFTEIYTVTFMHVNQLPAVELSSSSLSVDEGKEVSVTATATDKESSELTYRWVQTQGIEVAIENVNSSTLSFMAPNVSVTSELGFKLSVSDGEGETEQSVIVTINNVPEALATPKEGDKSGGGSFSFFLLLLAALFVYRRVQLLHK